MDKLTVSKKSILRDRRGATMVEYVLLVGVVALIALVGFQAFGTKLDKKINDEAGKVEGIQF